MNCKKCNAHIADNALYCTACGDRTAVHAQKEKIHALKKKATGILKEQIHTPLFWVLAICITLITIFQIITLVNSFENLFDGGIAAIAFVISATLCIFYVLSTIGAWKLLLSKNDATNEKDIKLFSFYPRVQRVIAILINILAGIVAGVLLLVGFIGGSLLSSIGDFSSNLSDSADSVEGGEAAADMLGGIAELTGMGSAIMIILSILIAVVIMVAAISHGRAWRKIIKLLSTMSEVSMGNNYPRLDKNSSCVTLYIWGSLFGVGSVALLALEVEFISILPGIATGAFMFVFALFFQSFHNEEEANRKLLAKENAKLEEINEEIDGRLRGEEIKRREDTEARMQQMMAMMMTNMSQNKNGNMQDMMKAMNKQPRSNSPKTGK